MKLYHYAENTGVFLYSSDAVLSPLDAAIKAQKINAGEKDIPEDVYIIPAFATTVAPPQAGTNQAAIFMGGA